MITLKALDKAEAIRWLGGAGVEPNSAMTALLGECERVLLKEINAKYLYRIISLPCGELTQGNDIKNHLDGCRKAAVMCVTLGAGVDRLLRISQIEDMSRAVVYDSLASAAVEQLCDEVEGLISAEVPGAHFTFRFSPGYGDYPLSAQKYLLRLLDAPRRIGLSLTDSLLLTPTKSVTAVIGLSDQPIPRGKRGCAVCSLRESCAYRRKGTHCGSENTSER